MTTNGFPLVNVWAGSGVIPTARADEHRQRARIHPSPPIRMAYRPDMAISATPPPPGAAWVGDWDEQFGDRVFGFDAVNVGGITAMVTGVQNRDRSTATGVALRVQGTVITADAQAAVVADLTPAQASELAAVLTALASRAEEIDRL